MLVEVCLLSVLLTRSPERCEVGKREIRLESDKYLIVTAIGQGEPQLVCGGDLEAALAHDLALVKEVRHILIEKADNNLLVWIAVDNPTRPIRERVFQKELELIEGFPEIDFDFNLISAMNRDPREFASSAKVIYSREDSNVAN